jgi:23S rRNA maturation mini-RNase III
LAPFLIVIRGLSFDESYSIIRDWIVRCSYIEMLKPSIEYFNNRIKAAINNSIQSRIPPMLIENIQKRYPDWYRHLKEQNIFSNY